MTARRLSKILAGAALLAMAGAHAGGVAATDPAGPQVVRLWPGEAVSQEVQTPEGRIRNIDVPTLTAFLPNKPSADGMAIIVCPGGGYSSCDFHRHGVLLAERLNREGVAVFVLKYLFETGGHGAFTVGGPPPGGQWPDRFLEWMMGLEAGCRN